MKKILCTTASLLIIPLSWAGSNQPEKPKRIALSTGVELEYMEKGDPGGVPVVFLHGICDSWHSFQEVINLLPPGIHGFALSQRGHGDSERPASGYRPADFASDVAAFIKQKNLGSAIVVGHSMGGVHAQQFVLDYPELSKGIVIIASDSKFTDNPGMPEFYSEVMNMKGSISRPFMEDFQKATLTRPIDSAYFELLVVEGMKPPLEVFKAAFTGLMEIDFTTKLAEINKPVLVLWGDKDSFCDEAGQEPYRKNLKQGKIVIYPGFGHALHWEDPQRVVNDLVTFIESIRK